MAALAVRRKLAARKARAEAAVYSHGPQATDNTDITDRGVRHQPGPVLVRAGKLPSILQPHHAYYGLKAT